jgi:protein-disulfide isomerase
MHKGAFDAAVAAECASQQNKFPAMHDLLVTNQDHSTEGLATTATQAGLDVARFRSCMATGDAKAQVLLDMDEARKNGIDGTPSLFLDGQAIDLPNSPDDLRKVLEAKLKPHDETYSRLQSDPTADDQTRK